MLQPILFVTSNGAGLGHLTRSMAIARRLPAGLQPLFLTLSQALPVVRGQGFLAEYLFSAGYAGTDRRRWNPLFEQRLSDVIDQYHPAAVIFDGTYPYLGLISVLRARPDLPFVWCRRAMWRPNTGGDNLRYSSLFELILEPGEFAAEMDRGLTTSHRYQAVSVPPILYCDESELLPRPVAEQELGLKPDRINVLLQLGAGNINDISSLAGMCVERLRREDRFQLVVAQSTIAGRSVTVPPGVHRVSTYPLSRLYRAFDFSISACGYNSYHELVGFALPALFVPNVHTALDDQLARARYAERVGVGQSWEEPTPQGLERAVAPLLDDRRRTTMAERCGQLRFENGAGQAAALIADLLHEPVNIGSQGTST